MLRCAGCGDPVSEWAARCPTCLHFTDDAVPLDPPPGSAIGEDEAVSAAEWTTSEAGSVATEVRPKRGRIWLPGRAFPAVGAALLVIVATIVTVDVATSGTGSSNGSGVPEIASALPGRVIAETQDGLLRSSRPDGVGSTPLRTAPFQPDDEPVLAEPNGEVVADRSDVSSLAASSVDSLFLPLPLGSGVVEPDPFADGRRAVVVMNGKAGASFTSAVSVVTLTDDRSVAFGAANYAAGDPLAVGAFVTVASRDQPTARPAGAVDGLADAQVERRDEGRPAVVLATAAQLNHLAGLDPSDPVNLTVFPDADGRKVAVMLNRLDTGESNSAMVILDRDGRVLGVVAADAGPVEYGTPVWSPDGSSLAYETFGSVGTSLAVVNGRYQVAAQAFEPTTRVDGCTWSPDGAWVLCLAASASTENWVLAMNNSSLTPIFTLPGRASPVAWLP